MRTEGTSISCAHRTSADDDAQSDGIKFPLSAPIHDYLRDISLNLSWKEQKREDISRNYAPGVSSPRED